jgi:hypothetical protein
LKRFLDGDVNAGNIYSLALVFFEKMRAHDDSRNLGHRKIEYAPQSAQRKDATPRNGSGQRRFDFFFGQNQLAQRNLIRKSPLHDTVVGGSRCIEMVARYKYPKTTPQGPGLPMGDDNYETIYERITDPIPRKRKLPGAFRVDDSADEDKAPSPTTDDEEDVAGLKCTDVEFDPKFFVKTVDGVLKRRASPLATSHARFERFDPSEQVYRDEELRVHRKINEEELQLVSKPRRSTRPTQRKRSNGHKDKIDIGRDYQVAMLSLAVEVETDAVRDAPSDMIWDPVLAQEAKERGEDIHKFLDIGERTLNTTMLLMESLHKGKILC